MTKWVCKPVGERDYVAMPRWQGRAAPGNIERGFTTLKSARKWLRDCKGKGFESGRIVDEASGEEVDSFNHLAQSPRQ